MSISFTEEVLKICVAQICQNIGWHAVQSSPLDILINVLHRYLLEVCKSVHLYSCQYNRTEANLDDLGLALKDFNVIIQEIEEYANNVESVPFAFRIKDFPVKRPSNLQIPKPDSRELLMRPDHIPSYLPPLHPDIEEEAYPQQTAVDDVKKEVITGCDSPSPLSSPKNGLKRTDWTSDSFNKRSRNYIDEEGRPMREVTSVFMTPSGFVSPVHVGKCADASLPVLVDSPPPTPEPPPPTTVSSKKDNKSKDVKKEKSSKPKKDKDSSKKDSKKLKSSKKEKENKDSISKHNKVLSGSFISKKEHSSSHKSSKSDKNKSRREIDLKAVKLAMRQKSKSQKDEAHKMKENSKKGKLKHSGASGSSSHMKNMKLSNLKKFKAAKLAKAIEHFKGERTKNVETPLSPSLPPPPLPPTIAVPIFPKEIPSEPKISVIESPVKNESKDEYLEDEDMDFREESPETRLVIDDSLETQARQERESRLEVIDECIEAVIRRGEAESETESKAMDETINAVIRGRKLEAKDIYDFTDASDSSSLSSCDMLPHSPIHTLLKKEEKSVDNSKKSDNPKRSKKEKKKKVKDGKAKSSSPPKNQKSNFILKVKSRTPSPTILQDDLLSSDGSTPSSSPRSNSFFDRSTPAPDPTHHSQLLPHPPPFVPGSNYGASPFAQVQPLSHLQTNPHFPTPPLFVTPSKSENGTSFQNLQPLNLAKSGPSSLKSSPEKSFEFNSTSHTSAKDTSDLIKKAANILGKPKAKDHRKDKVKKKGRKETEKVKEKKEKEEIKEKEVKKPKEKPKVKSEKNAKPEKKKPKLDKKKRDKEEKIKEDSTVPKMTLKLASGSGSTKIFVKPNTKNSTSLSSSPSPTHDNEDDIPSPPPRVPTPSPVRDPTPPPPPPPPRSPTPPPRTPTPPPKEVKADTPPPVPPPPVTKSTHSRGRGRGRKAASAANPPARAVFTETLGTIIDESGNKVWICPACAKPDDGSPMIGCDECDDWYHWICVHIVVPPKDEEDWFCERCVRKRKTKPKEKRRGKKHKKEK